MAGGAANGNGVALTRNTAISLGLVLTVLVALVALSWQSRGALAMLERTVASTGVETKTQIGHLQEEMRTLRGEVCEMRESVSKLREDMATLKAKK